MNKYSRTAAVVYEVGFPKARQFRAKATEKAIAIRKRNTNGELILCNTKYFSAVTAGDQMKMAGTGNYLTLPKIIIPDFPFPPTQYTQKITFPR